MHTAGTIAIAGTGRLAQALGRLLVDAGQPLAAIAGRDPERTRQAAAFAGATVRALAIPDLPATADHLLIAVADDAIADVAAALAAAGMKTGVALHTSGARGPEALAALATSGVSCGVLHPLQTIATPGQGISSLRGAPFGIGGSPAALEWAERLVELFGGTPLRIREGAFAAYHAGAVMAGNAVIAALDAAVSLLEMAGVERSRALAALGPLCLTSAQNTIDLGPEAALTGPVQRGDVSTIRRHANALRAASPELWDFYRAASRALLDIAQRRGLDARAAAAISDLLDDNTVGRA